MIKEKKPPRSTSPKENGRDRCNLAHPPSRHPMRPINPGSDHESVIPSMYAASKPGFESTNMMSCKGSGLVRMTDIGAKSAELPFPAVSRCDPLGVDRRILLTEAQAEVSSSAVQGLDW